MRLMVLLAILAVVAFALGWWYFRDTSETWEIIIDKEEVITETEEAVERGREWLDEAADEAEDVGSEDEPGPLQGAEERHNTEIESPESELQGAIP